MYHNDPDISTFDRTIDQAVSAILDEPIHEDARDKTLRVIAARLPATAPTDSHSLYWRSLVAKPAFRLSVAAAIAVALLGAILSSFSWTGHAAFADSIAKVNAAQSVSFTSTITTTDANRTPRTTTMQITIA